MNDAFLEVLHRQYFDQIHECVKECSHFHPVKHNKIIDYTKLSEKLQVLLEAATVDGIAEHQFQEWVDEVLPLAQAPVSVQNEKKAA